MPRWVVGAITFNNTSAFPLLLVQSLATTGVLAPLLAGPNDTESDALDRAKSYFLISAVVSNTMTFGAGPSQLKRHEEDAPNQAPNVHWQDEAHSGNQDDPEDQTQGDGQEDQAPDSGSNRTSLLPDHINHQVYRIRNSISSFSRRMVRSLPEPLRRVIMSIYRFLTPPLVGGIIGAIIGLIPPLHRLFFAETDHGGYFTAWITESVKRMGQLFVSLQMVIVGVKLSVSLRKEKRHEDTGSLSWGPLLLTAIFRFILWPA